MRNRLVLILLLLSIEARGDVELDLAFKGGPNATTLSESDQVSRFGLSGGIGAYLQWRREERLSFAAQMDVLYTQRGAKAVFDGEYLGRARTHYFDLTFSICPRVRFGQMGIYFLLGGGLDLLASASKEDAAGFEVNIIDDLYRVDVALLVGVGAAWHLPKQEIGPFRIDTVFLEVRYDHGLLDVDAVNGGYKNRASSLMLGVSFALGGAAEPAAPATSPGAVP